jgi:hypothetical protein
MLILQIALGVVLGFLILSWLPHLIALGIWVLLATLGLALLAGLVFFWEAAVAVLAAAILLFGYIKGIGLIVDKIVAKTGAAGIKATLIVYSTLFAYALFTCALVALAFATFDQK